MTPKSMAMDPHDPLTDEELEVLDQCLLSDATHEEAMDISMLDGLPRKLSFSINSSRWPSLSSTTTPSEWGTGSSITGKATTILRLCCRIMTACNIATIETGRFLRVLRGAATESAGYWRSQSGPAHTALIPSRIAHHILK
jgi:hypothetical protein